MINDLESMSARSAGCESEVPSTIAYSESFCKDGFPITPGPSPLSSPRLSAPVPRIVFACENDDEMPLKPGEEKNDECDDPPDPCTQRRRRQILQAQATTPLKKREAPSQPKASGKKSAKAKILPKAKVAERQVSAGDDEALQRPRLAKTKDGRFEVCAYTNDGKRVHVTTVQSKAYGKHLEKHMIAICTKIEKDNITKREALLYKDMLKNDE